MHLKNIAIPFIYVGYTLAGFIFTAGLWSIGNFLGIPIFWETAGVIISGLCLLVPLVFMYWKAHTLIQNKFPTKNHLQRHLVESSFWYILFLLQIVFLQKDIAYILQFFRLDCQTDCDERILPAYIMLVPLICILLSLTVQYAKHIESKNHKT